MSSTLAKITLISFILVTVIGIFLFVGICGGTGISSLFGMSNCPTSIMHHIAVFSVILSATVVAVGVLSPRLRRVFAASVSREHDAFSSDIFRAGIQKEQGINLVFDTTQRFFGRGSLRGREDSDSDNH